MKKASLVLLLGLTVLSSVALSACNATQGLGKDVQNTGKDISTSAQDNK